MVWRTVGKRRYCQLTYRDYDRKVRTLYFGSGPVAEAVAHLHMRHRERLLEIREASEPFRRALEAARKRLDSIANTVDHALQIAGYYKHHGTWRRPGMITMRTLKEHGRGSRLDIIQQEVTRRQCHTLDAVELATQLERLTADLNRIAPDQQISQFTDDPSKQEAIRLQLDHTADQLAGAAASPLIRILARSVAILDLECVFAGLRHCQLHAGLGPSVQYVQQWLDIANRRHDATIRILLAVQTIDACSIERTRPRPVRRRF